jgi:hypothetical protein
MPLRTDTPDATKIKLRKVKTVPAKVKAAVYAGCSDPGAAVQFQQDVATYNLWEALLYVESYEKDGFFTTGTAAAAIATVKA